VIEDFFRLSSDAVRFYPKECLASSLSVPIFSAALSSLTLQQIDPLMATLHYYHDLFSFAFDKPAVSSFTAPDGKTYTNPPEIQEAVKQLIASQGQVLVQRILTGMMFTFPGECFPDASSLLMSMFELMPPDAGGWVQSTLQMLPTGTMKPGEAERLLSGISEKVQSGETRKIRVLLQGMNMGPRIVYFPSANVCYRLHQLIPTSECGTQGRARPIGSHTVQV
jgi:transportin-3